MDLVSIFISLILVSFFLSNYLYKYKEEKQEKISFVYVIAGFVLEWLIIFSFILNYNILLYMLLLTFFFVCIYIFVLGIFKINKLQKEGKSNKECIILGLRNVSYYCGGLILIIQWGLSQIHKKLFKN